MLGLIVLFHSQIKNIDLSVRIKEFGSLLVEFHHIKFPLVARFDRGPNIVLINGIIKLDLIQHLESLQLTPCLRVWIFLVPTECVSFGEVGQFLLT